MHPKLVTGLRMLLGLMLVVFGLNGFISIIPVPTPPEPAQAYMAALVSANVLPIVKALEVILGLLLLTNAFVPLALVLLAPIPINAVLYHTALDPSTVAPALLLLALTIALLFAYLPYYRPFLTRKAIPGDAR